MQLRTHQQSAANAMMIHPKGQIIMATGAGKTYVMAQDIIQVLNNTHQCVLVVAAPRIMLAQQLCNEISEVIDTPFTSLEVHSGSSTSTTDPFVIYNTCVLNDKVVIFTTYHSLKRVVQSMVEVNTLYCDEAHNTVRTDFHASVSTVASNCKRSYYFTATPKHSSVDGKVGMNDVDVYGNIIAEALSPEMVAGGYILPPELHIPSDTPSESSVPSIGEDCNHILSCINDYGLQKVLVCASSTKQISNLMSDTHLMHTLHSRGYDWYVITSKHGALINGERVSRKTFFRSLRSKKNPYVLFHMRILGEGINLPSLDSCMLMRRMNVIDTLQTVGRVIRKGENKSVGKVIYPVYTSKAKKHTKALSKLIQHTFVDGVVPISRVTR